MENSRMGVEEVKSEKITANELQHFCDTITKNFECKLDFTIDFFDTNLGVLTSRESPSSLEFCVAALQEILSYLKPSHEIWDKVKYMAFILNLATRNIDFNILYNIYHQVEQQVTARGLEWREDEVKNLFDHGIVDNLIVKFDLSKIPDDIEDSKSAYDCEEVPAINEIFSINDDQCDNLEDDDEKFNIPVVDKPKRKYTKRKKREVSEGEESFKVKNEDNADEFINGEYVNDKELEFKEAKKKKSKLKRIQKAKTLESDGAGGEKKNKQLECQLCDFRGKYKSDLDKHAFTVHNSTRLCTQCGYISKSYDEWRLHDKTHTVTCDICNQKFLGKMSHMLHMAAVHKSSDDEKVPCDVCGTFLKPQSLKMHIFQVHGTQAFKCDLCDHTSSTKQLLAKHRKWHFRKMSKCPECGKMVKFLESHFKRQCSSSKPKERFNCELCDKTFSFKQGMTRHIKNVHQKISNFHCELCNYQTHYGYNFRVHMTTKHSKESFFKFCSICSKKTGNLDLHMKNYHYDEYMQTAKSEEVVQAQEEEAARIF